MGPFVLVWLVTFLRYAALPEPLIGGDSWQQLGIVMHIWSGNPPWTDSMFLGEYAFRDWLMYALVALVAKLTFLSPLRVAILFPVVAMAIGAAAMYGIGKATLRSELLAVGMAVAWMGVMPYMDFKSSSFAAMAMVPVVFYFVATLDASLKRRVYLGVAYGLASLSYIVAFFGLSLLLLLLFLHDALRPPRVATMKAAFATWLPVALVALPFVLALWGPILWVYGAEVKNPSHLFGDAGHGWSTARSLSVWRDLFLNTQHPVLLVVSLLSLFGVYAALRQFDSAGGRLALGALVVGLVGAFHFLVTEPLVHNNLVFFRYPKVFLHLAGILLAFQALRYFADTGRGRGRGPGRRAADPGPGPGPGPSPSVGMGTPAVALAFLLVGSVVLFPRVVSPYDESATVRTELSDAVDETRAWLLEETPRDAVFLGLDHESFALNAISGKKIVIERRSHANPFVDMDQRFADAAVMLYGTDRAEAGRIMDRYLVTHAYVGWYWDSNHRDFPLFTSPEHAEHWRGNGLQFVEEARPYDTIGEVQYFPVIRLVLPEGDPLFLREFRVAHRSFVAGQPAMTIYERIVAPP